MKPASLLLLTCLLLLSGCAPASSDITSGETTPGTSLPTNNNVPSPTPFLPVEETISPSPTQPAIATALSVITEVPMPSTSIPDILKITVVYNNIAFDTRLTTDWGFSAYIEYHDQVVLFDTGTKGQILLNNMHLLGIDPAAVEAVVLSHAHQDHIGGLPAFLEAAPHTPVYLLSSFGASYIQHTRKGTEVIESTPGLQIADDILTTGEIPGNVPEQALVIRTPQGLVVVTGCAHPGIVNIIEHAIDLTGNPVYLVMGGFHLRDLSRSAIDGILAEFNRLGVQQVAPSHCTGDLAMRVFAENYGTNYLESGVGSVIIIENK